MCHPLALFDELWLGCQGHEIALDNESGILVAKEEWRLSRARVALVGLLVRVHGCR